MLYIAYIPDECFTTEDGHLKDIYNYFVEKGKTIVKEGIKCIILPNLDSFDFVAIDDHREVNSFVIAKISSKAAGKNAVAKLRLPHRYMAADASKEERDVYLAFKELVDKENKGDGILLDIVIEPA